MSASAIRAGAAYIELTLRDKASRGLHVASVALKDFGNNVAYQGVRIAALGSAVTAPLAAMAHGFVQSMAEMGGAVNPRDAAAITRYMAAITALSRALGGLSNAIGSAVLPLMTQWPETLTRIVNGMTDWVQRNRALVAALFRVGAALVVAGTAITVLGQAIAVVGSVLGALSTVVSVVGSAIGMLGTLLAAMLTPMGAIITASLALGAAIFWSSGAAEESLAWLGEAFAQLKDDALVAWKGIGDALATGNIGLAAKIVWLTLKMEWQKGVNALNQYWISAKQFFMGIWSDAVYGLAGVFVDGWAMIESGWIETVDFLRDAWSVFTNFLSKTWNNTIGFVQKAWVRLKSLFDEDIDVNAEVNRINNETNASNAAADAKRDDAIGARDRARTQQRQDIENRRKASRDALTQTQDQENADRQKEFDRQRQESEQAVDDAKGEWQAANQQAAQERAKMERDRKRNPAPDLVASTLGGEKAKIESKGTFNALAATGLGADSLADRTARATESTSQNVKKLLDEVKRGGLLFT